MKIKLIMFIILWALAFFIIGMFSAKADLAMDSITNPAYAAMPQNLYHNTIYGHKSNNSKFDKCKTPGSVRKIIVEKSNKKMYLLDVNNCIVKEYAVRIGKNKGPKQCEGDSKTPEGIYHITEKRNSKYVKFLAIDYPRAKDIKKAKELGCNPGDSIGIHSWIEGLPKEGSQGCITVWTKKEILEINDLIKVGTEVEIKE